MAGNAVGVEVAGDMTGPEWVQWKNHSQTQKFLHYLKEGRDSLWEGWAMGAVQSNEQFARGRAFTLLTIINEIEGIRLKTEDELKREKEDAERVRLYAQS